MHAAARRFNNPSSEPGDERIDLTPLLSTGGGCRE